MSTLHTLNKAPSAQLLASCIKTLRKGDGLIFIEDGVYHVLESALLESIPAKVAVYALREDISARGLTDKCDESVELVGYRHFVELCVEHEKIVSWF